MNVLVAYGSTDDSLRKFNLEEVQKRFPWLNFYETESIGMKFNYLFYFYLNSVSKVHFTGQGKHFEEMIKKADRVVLFVVRMQLHIKEVTSNPSELVKELTPDQDYGLKKDNDLIVHFPYWNNQLIIDNMPKDPKIGTAIDVLTDYLPKKP